MQIHGNTRINENGHFEIGGVDSLYLTEKYSTPLFVYDENLIREQCRRFHRVLEKSGYNYHISYASKAFICKYLVRIMKEEDMGLDVVSAGELYNALAADFPSKNIHLHGNNKTNEEIEFAIKNDIGCFVVDSFDEMYRLDEIAKKHNKIINCLLRVTPGVEAHTHDFITTGKTDSKFGLNIDNGQAKQGVEKLLTLKNLKLSGFHFHIGSQIFGTEGSCHAIEKTYDWFVDLRDDLGYIPEVLNIGGGFGIRYTDEDISYPIEKSLEEIISTLKKSESKTGIKINSLWLEPGRSIVGEAGYTLYKIGTIKEIPDVRNYVSIDGGMSDHIRTALYGAKYEVAIANRMNEQPNYKATIAGKCCESGDMIAYDVLIPRPKLDDVLVVSCTGAYHYSMASNYNQMTKPAVVFVSNGCDRLAIKRESLDDLIKNQL